MTTIQLTRREGIRPITRALLVALAFAGSAVYALSFAATTPAQRWVAQAAAVGVAAGLSWILFGVLLIAVTRGRPLVVSWMDACLRTMAVGIAVKMAAVLLNVAWWGGVTHLPDARQFLVIHLVILACADAAMGARFCAESAARGVSIARAAALWVALNFVFGVLLFTFSRIGGWS